MKSFLFSLLAAGALLFCTTASIAKEIPAEVWADRENFRSVSMSRNGKRIAMIQRTERGGPYQVVTFDTDNIDGSFTRVDTGQSADSEPSSVFWSGNEHLVIQFTVRVETGKEVEFLRRIISLNIDTGESENLSRFGGTDPRDRVGSAAALLNSSSVVSLLPGDDDHILMSISSGFSSGDFYKVNIKNGSRDLVLKENSRLGGIQFDYDGEARLAQEYEPEGPQIRHLARAKGSTEWVQIDVNDSRNRFRFSPLGFFDRERPNELMIAADSPESNFTSIYAIDVRNPNERELVFQTRNFDAVGVLRSAAEIDISKITGFSYYDSHKFVRYYIDEFIGSTFESISQAFPDANVSFVRISDDYKTILFRTEGPQDPGTYYLLRDGRAAKVLSVESEISRDDLSPTKTIIAKARDGRDIPTLVTVPNGEGPFPGIVMPHGGPWVRDTYGYDEWAQMLANRGYVVVQPNYRGSTDLGREHWLAGDREWGQKMQDDIEDSILAAVDKGWVDRERMGIFGWSYGGYAAFAAATRDGENSIFNCSAAGAGVADITTIRGGLTGSRFARRFQQPTIDGLNPMTLADKVSMPMLVVHGDEDYTVPVRHSRLFVDGLKRGGTDYQYIEIKDMSHSPFFYNENMQWFPALFEFFETKCGF